MTLGFVVGKFYPPHRGHKYLIDFARGQVDHLIVMLCHHASQQIPGEVRQAWLREIHPDCDIRLVPDELPDESQPWASFTISYLGRAPDIVFSSEHYGLVFAGLMGAKHVMVDQPRQHVSISATAIRKSVLDHLDWLEPCVRAWFVKRVVLIGAESTGKTTLAAKLAEHFQTNWVAEFGREHWENKLAGLPIDSAPAWTPGEFVEIAREQQRREDLAARSANRVLMCDTNAFATGTWFERYQQARHAVVDEIGDRCKADLYLLPEPDVPFVQDGFRDGELIRDWMHERFYQQLTELKLPFKVLSGSYADRERQAISAVNEVLAKPLVW